MIGYGAPNKQGSSGVHGAPLGEDEVAAARERLGWPYPPFEIPEPIREAWLETGAFGKAAHDAWRERLARMAPERRAAFEAAQAGNVDDAIAALAELARRQQDERPTLATRQASLKAIEAIAPVQPGLVGGSADLTGSNLTQAAVQQAIGPGAFDGSYIHYGIREHAMGAVMNGLALHGGFIPYGGTFLAFADYARPAIRLSALMGQRVIYVMTHDSIGLGEDGPTHQPVEHLASLRAMPNLHVYRPADAVETAHAWACALESSGTPSVLCLSRQGLPTLARTDASREHTVARGAYVLRDARRRTRRDLRRHRLGSRPGRGSGRGAGAGGHPRRGGVRTVFRALRRTAVRIPPGRAGHGAAHRRGSRGRGRLGALAGRRRTLHRHARFRRLGAGRRALPAIRHHPRGARRGGTRGGDRPPHPPLTRPREDIMARITLRQLLDHAAEHGYGVPAFNINNMEQVLGIMKAASQVDAPVILQASRGARGYAGDIMLEKMVEAAEAMFPDIPICLHQDHGNDESTCFSAIQHGFTSVMMDGSLEADAKTPASYGYNVDITRRVTAMAHRVGVSVEGELGVLGSLETGQGEAEDGHGAEGVLSREQLLTDPDEAVGFVQATGVDALAIAMGTSHGAYKFSRKPDGEILALDVVKAIHRRLPGVHLVMHGSSSVPQELQDIFNQYGGEMPQTFGVPVEEIETGIRHGVRKVNIDTDCRLAMAGQIRRVAQEKPAEFDPRTFLLPAIDALVSLCRDRYERFGAAGQASRIKPVSLAAMAARYASGALDTIPAASAAA